MDGNVTSVDFKELRGRINRLLYNAVQVESDAINTQTLLSGLMLIIQNSGLCNELEETPNLRKYFGAF